MADESTRRALFREVNTRICEIDSGFGTASAGYHVLCECGRLDCYERFAIPASLYDGVRATDDRYVVANGHQRDAETVVGSGLLFEVVESWADLGRVQAQRVSPSATVVAEPA